MPKGLVRRRENRACLSEPGMWSVDAVEGRIAEELYACLVSDLFWAGGCSGWTQMIK